MTEFPDKYFELAITSPPYNMNTRVRNGEFCSRQIVQELSTKYQNYDDNLMPEEYFQWQKSVIIEMLRVSKTVFYNIQQVTGNKQALYRLMGFFYENIKDVIIWDKLTGEPAIGAGVLNSCWEYILILSNDAITRSFDCARFQRGALDNIWRIPKSKGVVENHKASFPIDIPKTILKNFCLSGPVLDPFLGMGTTAIACHQMGYDLTGSELDKDYFQAMQQRIKQETAQTDLFQGGE
jgi:site-specific DNA-methyltransferase (adenine-specific)/modification methylase